MGLKYNDGMDIDSEIFEKRRRAMLAAEIDEEKIISNSVETVSEKKTKIEALWGNAYVKGTSIILAIAMLVLAGVKISEAVNFQMDLTDAKAYLKDNYSQSAANSYYTVPVSGAKAVDYMDAADNIVSDAEKVLKEKTGEKEVKLSHDNMELHLSIFASYLNYRSSFQSDTLRSIMNNLLERINSELGTEYENFEDYVKNELGFETYDDYYNAMVKIGAGINNYDIILAQMGIEEGPTPGGRS